RAASRHLRREPELNTEFLELHSDHGSNRTASGGGGQRREREFTAREEACLFALNRDQVRLSKNLQEIPALHGTNRRTDIQIRTEEEQVQNIGEVNGSIGEVLILELKLAESRRGELLRADRADHLVAAAEVIEPKLSQGSPVNAGKLHLQ